MPRPDSPPSEPAYDDETPESVQEHIRKLESLARELYAALSRRARSRDPVRSTLMRRAEMLLDIDPAGFDPATEGP